MIITSIKDYEVIQKIAGRCLVRIFFDKKQTHVCWLSEKQYTKLRECYHKVEISKVRACILCVFDGEGYVWSGVEYSDYSDRDWLMKNFKATYSDKFEVINEVVSHVPEKVEPLNAAPNADLIR